ncbi:type I-E CRISPR-associated protein Cas7/Cse4/CasC [Tessaracoccus sp. Z1128]
MTNYFVDVHILQDLPPSCINRDDNGTPKQATYGGVDRLRVSSQAWKRATRMAFEKTIPKEELGVRTRRVAPMVVKAFIERGLDETDAAAVTEFLLAPIKSKGKKETDLAYLLFFAREQLVRLVDAVMALPNDWRGQNQAAIEKALHDVDLAHYLSNGHSLDVALFGRMVADVPAINVDAAAQVAHALSTHSAEVQFDYYTAVDDEQEDAETGAGMIGTIEFNSATMYRYATVSTDQLLLNLGGDTGAMVDGVAEFIRAFALSMPSGHQSSYAAHTRPALLAVIVRADQPVNAVSAFEKPVWTPGKGFMAESQERLVDHLAGEAARWGDRPAQIAASYAATQQSGAALEAYFGSALSLDALLSRVRGAIQEASA